MTAPDLLQALHEHDGAAPALALRQGAVEQLRWSYAQLLQVSLGFRAALQAGGVDAGVRVCLVAGNSPQFVALFLACVELGAAFAPVHPDQAAGTLGDIMRDLRPALVIVGEELNGKALRAVLHASPRVWRLRLRRTPWLRPVLSGVTQRAKEVDAALPFGISEDPPVLILHSSGSTGAPKVILYSRERLNVFLHWQRHLFTAFPDVPACARPSPRVNALPLAHFGGLSFVLQALLDGRLTHLARTFTPREYLQLAQAEGCQMLMLVPALYEALLCDALDVPAQSSLRYCLTMGEAVTPQLVARVTQRLGVRVYSAYGMSEGLSGLSHHGDDTPPDSCGRRLFGETQLVDDEGNTDATEGELWVRNATTFPCYRDAALNAVRFRDGWYRTGDRFRRDALGHHYFLGRADAMCVINGRNLYPADVERVFLEHPGVADCMAAVMRLDTGRQRLGVLVCLRLDSRVTPAALLDWFLEHGALYATPAWLLLGKGIPRNAAGKRDRLAVAQLLQEDYARCLRKVS